MTDNAKGYRHPELLVTPKALSAALNSGVGPLLLDLRPAEQYAAGHLPGAVHLDIWGISLIDTDPAPLRAFLWIIEHLFAERGVSADRPVVLYEETSGTRVARAFWFLEFFGHPDVRVLDGGGTLVTDRLEQARAAGATAMLAVVLPRYPREALEALAEARATGLQTVTITDSPVSPATGRSDLALPAAVSSHLVFDLHTAPMVLSMALLQAMCDAAPAEAAERLEDFERSAARRHLFVD